MYKSNANPIFRNKFAEDIFNYKYARFPGQTWNEKAREIADDVCKGILSKSEVDAIYEMIRDMKFLPGGRYIYYAGRANKSYNNCYLLRVVEDTREEWGALYHRASDCLMSGGGIGINYDIVRPNGSILSRTGGLSSGPIPLMKGINEMGRQVMQGGSRRSAIYASLNHQHQDVHDFLAVKDWSDTIRNLKANDFNFPADLDMTNISINYDDAWLDHYNNTGDVGDVFLKNVEQALKTSEPGFSFNFGDKQNETLRNACTEVTSEDDSDVCNLGSLNMSQISNIKEFEQLTMLATKFLVCGTLRADLPYAKVYEVREKNRRLGLGLMGMHEWLIQRNYKYEANKELHRWLSVYRTASVNTARNTANSLNISQPVAVRAIAPTGSIGILAGTTTGVEPLFAVAYKRRYLKDGTKWCYQYVVDGAAKDCIDRYGVSPDKIESALDLSSDPERRMKFQADVQDYVDMSISSTINLPAYEEQSFSTEEFAHLLAKYAPRLRGFTCYADGSRGGQPLTSVPYNEAIKSENEEFEEIVHDICDLSGKGGTCGA